MQNIHITLYNANIWEAYAQQHRVILEENIQGQAAEEHRQRMLHHVHGLNEVVTRDNEEKMVVQPNLMTEEDKSQEDVIHNLNFTFSQLVGNTWEKEDLYEERR